MLGPGHGTAQRWAVVAALVALLVALPPLIGLLPASDADVSAVDLRARALASDDLQFSGYAESAGGLVLPVGERAFSRVVDLFSDRTQMRVWWRGDADHRVDVVSAGGETGFRRDGAGTWVWEYEDSRATRFGSDPLAVPSPPDLLPSSLGRRLLSEAADDELSRIGAERVAGREVLGLRMTPSEEAASVERVDIWIDARSGLPLQVRIFGDGSDLAALDSRFLDLDLTAPDAGVTRFAPPPGAQVSRDRDRGLLEEARRSLPRTPLPGELAGLPRRSLDGVPEGIGLYGRGVTLLAVAPVSGRVASELTRGLRADPEVVDDGQGPRISAGPLGVAVLHGPGGQHYVVTGTVTLDALADAAAALRQEN